MMEFGTNSQTEGTSPLNTDAAETKTRSQKLYPSIPIQLHADEYRAELQELSGHSSAESDGNKLKQDLETLLQWKDSERSPEETA